MSMIGTIRERIVLRNARRGAAEMLRHAAHVENLRSDVLSRSDLDALRAAVKALEQARKGREPGAIGAASAKLESCLLSASPPRGHHALRENIEVVFVAIAVAMGFRAYLLQPFKIPTGSMQPSLYGIHSSERDSPDWTDRTPAMQLKWLVTGDSYLRVAIGPTVWDRFPLKILKFAVTREWYRPYAGAAPVTGPYTGEPYKPHMLWFAAGPNRYWVPKDAVMRGELRIAPGSFARVGDVLWEGTMMSGDHLFVNKIAWNFRAPRRGEVTVFSTDGIGGLPPGTHYIKRMIGLPGESISIHPPDVLVNGAVVREPLPLARIARRDRGYDGFTLAAEHSDGILCSASDVIRLSERQYFVLGDNTTNSRDGRYWGTVPERNLVGPALVVYWPLSGRWGRVR